MDTQEKSMVERGDVLCGYLYAHEVYGTRKSTHTTHYVNRAHEKTKRTTKQSRRGARDNTSSREEAAAHTAEGAAAAGHWGQ